MKSQNEYNQIDKYYWLCFKYFETHNRKIIDWSWQQASIANVQDKYWKEKKKMDWIMNKKIYMVWYPRIWNIVQSIYHLFPCILCYFIIINTFGYLVGSFSLYFSCALYVFVCAIFFSLFRIWTFDIRIQADKIQQNKKKNPKDRRNNEIKCEINVNERETVTLTQYVCRLWFVHIHWLNVVVCAHTIFFSAARIACIQPDWIKIYFVVLII